MKLPIEWRLIALLCTVASGCAPAPTADTGRAAKRGPTEPVAVERGAVVDVSVVEGRAAARLAAPTGAERFLVVLASTRFAAEPRDFEYAMTQGAARPTPVSAPRTRCSLDAGPWRAAAAAARPARATAAAPSSPRTDVPSSSRVVQGATRTFEMRVRRGGSMVRAPVPARAVAVGESSVVWADVSAEHPATLEPAFVAEFLSDFEKQILPRARQVFGRESDVDGDGRVALLFTPLTAAAAVAFFSGCDLEPVERCPGSNRAELLYLTPPNAIRPPYNTPRAIKEILAHEVEHLVHHHQKVLRNRLPDDPDSAYLLEGFGALAQDVIGFQAGNLYVTKAGLDEIDDFSLGPVLAPGAGYDRNRDGALRGGAYLFVRWLYDRAGGDRALPDGDIEDLGGPALVHALLQAPGSVIEELPRRVGSSLADLAMDFYTTLGHDPRVLPNPCFSYLPTTKDPVTERQRGADLFASFHGMEMGGPAVQPPGSADGRLRGGGVEYLALPAPRAGELAFTVQVAPQAEPRVRVVRLR
jgi:hypothetical protein